MTSFVGRNIIFGVSVMLAASFFAFALMYLSGDPSSLFLPMEASAEEVEAYRKLMGFDDPWYEQYWRFLVRALRGDFGQSLRHGRPALELVMDRLPASAKLSALALAISVLIAIPVGLISAVYRNTGFDTGARTMALLGQSLPPFLLGALLILLFAGAWKILPASGSGSFKHLILPGLSLGISHAAMMSRLLRSNLQEVLSKEYIRVARAKGVSEWMVLVKHALRNAAISVVTVMGLQLGRLIGGAVITEQVFGYPGVGRLVIQAIGNRDFAVVQTFVVVMAVIIVVLTILVDLVYTLIDPRIRTG